VVNLFDCYDAVEQYSSVAMVNWWFVCANASNTVICHCKRAYKLYSSYTACSASLAHGCQND